MESTPVIKFKYLTQRQIHLGDGRLYEIPYRLGPKMVNGKPDPACQTSVPIFNMEFIHEVELLDERPEEPVREDYMDDDFYKDLCRESYKVAHENRQTNNKIRRALKIYEESGTIKVVEDPFKTKATAKAAAAAAELSTSEGDGVSKKGIKVPADGKTRTVKLDGKDAESSDEK